jgi:hypothetical protein
MAVACMQVYPEHKFLIVETLRQMGYAVGMTGDGVNDAPALKQADVGIAVHGATDAARAASDIVLSQPGLSTIITGIQVARVIFQRMQVPPRTVDVAHAVVAFDVVACAVVAPAVVACAVVASAYMTGLPRLFIVQTPGRGFAALRLFYGGREGVGEEECGTLPTHHTSLSIAVLSHHCLYTSLPWGPRSAWCCALQNFLTYRIAATMQLVFFFFIALLAFDLKKYQPKGEEWPEFFFVPVLLLLLITVLNDGTLITIGYDNVKAPDFPAKV